jgi:O-succinylbenzoic acid--CoA ligase
MSNGPSLVEELRRAWDDGDAVLPLDVRLGLPARHRVLEVTRPALLIEEGLLPQPLAGSRPIEDGDSLVMATSGTTGEPKGVVLTHGAVTASAVAASERLGVDPESDAWWACLPLSHVGGLSVVTRAIVGGVRCEVGGFSPEAAALAIARGATLTSLVPTALGRLEPEVAAAFRRIVLGGQAPPAGLPANVTTTYGLTETGSGVVYDGIPLAGVGVRIVAGEIHLRGPMLLRAYRNERDPKDGDGWLPTGDAGAITADGRLAVLGRLHEMIITGGENVWPAAVESVLTRHAAVAEAAVAGIPDPEWGERVVAYVVVVGQPELSRLLGELRELVSGELAPFAAPRQLVVVDALPRTAIGKVRREALLLLDGRSALA